MAEIIDLRIQTIGIENFCELRYQSFVNNGTLILPRLERAAIYHFTLLMGSSYDMIPDEDQNEIDAEIGKIVHEWHNKKQGNG